MTTIYDWQYDPDSLAEHHIYTALAADAGILALLGNAGLNRTTGRPQIYPRRAPQAGAAEPFGIYAMASDSTPLADVADYVWSDSTWLVKWVGFDYQEDVLRKLNKMALDALNDTGPVYAGMGRIVECAYESSPRLPEETLPGGAILVQRGSIFRIKVQPDGA